VPAHAEDLGSGSHRADPGAGRRVIRTVVDALVRYNQGLVRGLFHFGVVASFLLTFARAPFQHFHPSDPQHEHDRGFAHTHWGNVFSDGPSWDAKDHDSDARLLDWLAGDGSATAKVTVALPHSIGRACFTIHVAPFPEITPHNHDPPGIWYLSPRGPPA